MCDAMGTAKPAVRIDNDRVRVTEWSFAKSGDNTGWHRHGFDYVVVPLFDGVLEIAHPDGTRTEAVMQRGVPYFRKAGVEHDVINGNDFACAFVETELLEEASAG
ncbi:cupin domain-containing protein [Leisingera sp. NJS204]|uniref:cupin domain-containing protein n=1 Tax=Leisingera sp. NJS204 TaxID=2508307 RepID=UPI001011F0BA|nr:cupin domain-containing protein [Leisingera sp. NJS204]QAX31182.1 cupin [Leisingera sp. NJS204]